MAYFAYLCTGMSCPSWQREWHRTGYSWSPVWTLQVVSLWCDLRCCSRTVVVIKQLQAAANLHLTPHFADACTSYVVLDKRTLSSTAALPQPFIWPSALHFGLGNTTGPLAHSWVAARKAWETPGQGLRHQCSQDPLCMTGWLLQNPICNLALTS